MADEQLRQVKMKQDKAPTHSASPNTHEHVHTHSTTEKTEENKTEVKAEEKKKKIEVKKVKKDHAIVYGRSLPISLRHSVAIGKFIKGKKINEAIKDLEQVLLKKKAVPFTGELGHKKGKGMSTGKYPVKASGEFIKILKSLTGNSIANGMDLDKTIISETIPNKSPSQIHRYGRTKFKRTHLLIKSIELKHEGKKTGGKK